MDNSDLGRLPIGTRLSPSVEPVPVSPLRASIPSAAKWALFYDDYPDCERIAVQYDCNSKYFPDRAQIIWNGSDDNTVYATPEEARWLSGLLLQIAQAIETRRAATGTGAVHESAVGETDAPTPSSEPRLSTLGDGE
jgi:hypothetical protein